MQPAATGPVLVAEQSIGVEVVGDPLTQFDHDAGIDGAGVLDQRALSRRHVGGRNAGRQHIYRPAYRLDVVVTDGAGRHCSGQLGQFRRHRRPGQRPARPDPGGQFEPAGDLLRSDAQIASTAPIAPPRWPRLRPAGRRSRRRIDTSTRGWRAPGSQPLSHSRRETCCPPMSRAYRATGRGQRRPHRERH